MPLPDRRGDPLQIRCPDCQRFGTSRRSRTLWWERPLRLVSRRKPYHCGFCDARFWLGPWRERRTTRPGVTAPLTAGPNIGTQPDRHARIFGVELAERPARQCGFDQRRSSYGGSTPGLTWAKRQASVRPLSPLCAETHGQLTACLPPPRSLRYQPRCSKVARLSDTVPASVVVRVVVACGPALASCARRRAARTRRR